MTELYIQKFAYDPVKKDVGHEVAYSLLERLCHEKLGTYPGKVEKDENGKPYFAEPVNGVKYYFSISHSKGYVAALLTDLADCGVDIEPEITEESAEKISARFLSDGILCDRFECEINHRLLEFDGALITEELEHEGKTVGATVGWTTLEAVLKSDGRGFAAFKIRNQITEKTRTRVFRLIDGDKNVYVAIAIKK